MKEKNKGITLIALIITIIVMLILVGVTVNVAQNGRLFNVSKKAAYQTEVSQILELSKVEIATLMAENEDISKLTIADLNIPDNLKQKYSDKLIIDEGEFYYNIETVTDEEEQSWLKEIGINEYLLGYKYYSNLDLAIADANDLTTDNGSESDSVDTCVALYIDNENESANILFLKNIEQTTDIQLVQNTILSLNKKTLTLNKCNIIYSKDLTLKNGKITTDANLSTPESIKSLNTSSMQEGTLKVENLEFEKLNPTYSYGSSICNIKTTSKYVFIKDSKITLEASGDSYAMHPNVVTSYADKVVIENCDFSCESVSAPQNLSVSNSNNVEINNCNFYVKGRGNGVHPYITNIYGSTTINGGTFKAETLKGNTCYNVVYGNTIVNGAKFESDYCNIYNGKEIKITDGVFNVRTKVPSLNSYNIYSTDNYSSVIINNGSFNSYSSGADSYCVHVYYSAEITGGTFESEAPNGTSYGIKINSGYGRNVSEGVSITADVP